MNDPLNQDEDNFDEQAADLGRSMDILRVQDGFDPLRKIGNIGWKAQENEVILRKDAIVGLTGVNVSLSPSDYVEAAYTSASSIPGA